MKIKASFVSTFDEGVVETDCVVDLISGEVDEIQAVECEHEHLQSEQVSLTVNNTDMCANVTCNESGDYFISTTSELDYLREMYISGKCSFATFIQEVSITDPETEGTVEIAIYKDQSNGAMFGVDASYILTLSDDDPVSNPFTGKDIQLVEGKDNGKLNKIFLQLIEADFKTTFCSPLPTTTKKPSKPLKTKSQAITLSTCRNT
tara:strand:+ start:939 stop:1553 length:615 start_codon:yes stop_codon:yes gene_type:complete